MTSVEDAHAIIVDQVIFDQLLEATRDILPHARLQIIDVNDTQTYGSFVVQATPEGLPTKSMTGVWYKSKKGVKIVDMSDSFSIAEIVAGIKPVDVTLIYAEPESRTITMAIAMKLAFLASLTLPHAYRDRYMAEFSGELSALGRIDRITYALSIIGGAHSMRRALNDRGISERE